MNYFDMRKNIQKMASESHEDFVKALISVEKGVTDRDALKALYEAYMDNDSQGLLNDEFDVMIDDMREKGQIKDAPQNEIDQDDLVNFVGNIVGDVDVVERENKSGETFQVANFTVVTKDDEGQKHYINCSAYGDKSEIPKNFKTGDFVKVFGQERFSVDANGKAHSNIRVLSSKLLKAREQMKSASMSVEDLKQKIASLKQDIEERNKDHYFADSWEQASQISDDIGRMETKLQGLKSKLKSLEAKEKPQISDRKDSVLGAIKKFQEADKAVDSLLRNERDTGKGLLRPAER